MSSDLADPSIPYTEYRVADIEALTTQVKPQHSREKPSRGTDGVYFSLVFTLIAYTLCLRH